MNSAWGFLGLAYSHHGKQVHADVFAATGTGLRWPMPCHPSAHGHFETKLIKIGSAALLLFLILLLWFGENPDTVDLYPGKTPIA